MIAVDWTLVVTDAAPVPPFSLDAGSYALQTPCAAFVVSSTITNAGNCDTCDVYVNGNKSAFTFNAATAVDFVVQLCQDDCSAGPALTYTFAVQPRLHVLMTH